MERIRGGWANVPQNLKCKTDLKEMGMKPTGDAKAEVWNSHIWVKLYDINETVPRKPATEKQMVAIEKARAAQLAARTCSRCESIVKRNKTLFQGLCDFCREKQYIQEARESALKFIQSWVEDKSKYLILDTETTGSDDGSEIVDIAIIDLDENILFDSLVKPSGSIPEEATAIHGITNEMVENAPTWPLIWSQVQQLLYTDKTVLIYNADFDKRMIRGNCKRHGIDYSPFGSFCVMQTYAEYAGRYSSYHRDFTWISLREAAYDYDIRLTGESHRAKADCITTARLVKDIAGEK